jgi:hypothetical protein
LAEQLAEMTDNVQQLMMDVDGDKNLEELKSAITDFIRRDLDLDFRSSVVITGELVSE